MYSMEYAQCEICTIMYIVECIYVPNTSCIPLYIYIYIYIYIVIVILFYWIPLIPSRNLYEVFTYNHIWI